MEYLAGSAVRMGAVDIEIPLDSIAREIAKRMEV